MKKEQRILEALFTPLERLTPVQWAEKYRYLPPEVTNFDGPMRYDLTPYLRGVANSIESTNPAQIISIMKGSQLGFSIGGLFSMLGWIISQSPANTLFITETVYKVKDQMSGPISHMINNSNLVNLVGNVNVRTSRNAKGKRNGSSGDTKEELTFDGGKLYTWSGQKIGSLSSWSIKYGIYDEIERWKGQYKNAGDFLSLVEPRHKSYANNMKMIFGSTPEIKQTSNIEPLYLKGDQQKYHIPCKHCGAMIDLKWQVKKDSGYAGVVFKRDKNGKFEEGSAEYVCQLCGGVFKESHKFDMYEEENISWREREAGRDVPAVCEWIPTAEPENWRYQSMHISSLYSPVGFFDWNKYARDWCEIHPINGAVKVGLLHGFVNQTLGETFEERGRELSTETLVQNRRNYKHGTIPTLTSIDDGNGEIVFITCAVDLNGVIGDKVEDDDVRLDYEVTAWCVKGDEEHVVSYSIDHGSIGSFMRLKEKKAAKRRGQYDDAKEKMTYRHGYKNSVWSVFEKEVLFKQWKTEDDKVRRINMCGVDVGNFTAYANEFVYQHNICVALKGDPNERTKFGNKSFFMKGKKDKLYIVAGNVLKDNLADEMEFSWSTKQGVEQPNGFMNFPREDYKKYTYKDYFIEYEGERKIVEKDVLGNPTYYYWTKKHSEARQHFFDCKIYNKATMRIGVEMICKSKKVTVSWRNFCKLMGAKVD